MEFFLGGFFDGAFGDLISAEFMAVNAVNTIKLMTKLKTQKRDDFNQLPIQRKRVLLNSYSIVEVN